ncbi:MAG: NADH:flavin oxidoreductase [Planctomycetota bacterium]|nr:NADH:flavin oxidoreductase [Planctomycetota bacterium]
MKYTPPGRIKSVEEFRETLQRHASTIDCLEDHGSGSGPLGQPIRVAGKRLSNRFCVHPMEGWDANEDGSPSDYTLRRWCRFGESGAELIWGGEAYAVQEDGRANPNQLFMNPAGNNEAWLGALMEQLRRGAASIGKDPDTLVTGLQLTHSGRFSRPDAKGPRPRILHHHPQLARKYNLDPALPLITDGDLRKIRDSFITAAQLAQRVGFDFVDIKCAHGYLLHEALAARTREGDYGGSMENRLRLVREIIEGIKQTCPGLHIGTRVSITDRPPFEQDPKTGEGIQMERDPGPWPYGFGVAEHNPDKADLFEPFAFLALMQVLGVRLINVSVGSPYYCPHVQRPATYPPSDGYMPPKHPLDGVRRHIEATRAVKERYPDLIVVGSGYTWLQEYLPHVAALEVLDHHADFIGLGRMMLSYPHMPRDFLEEGRIDGKKLCRTFSDCTTGPRNGMISGCYPLDPQYASLPQAATISALRRDSMKGGP